MESLSVHPGLKVFMDDLQGYRDAIASSWPTIKPDQLQYEQGRYAGLGQALDQFKMLESIKSEALLAELNTDEHNV